MACGDLEAGARGLGLGDPLLLDGALGIGLLGGPADDVAGHHGVGPDQAALSRPSPNRS